MFVAFFTTFPHDMSRLTLPQSVQAQSQLPVLVPQSVSQSVSVSHVPVSVPVCVGELAIAYTALLSLLSRRTHRHTSRERETRPKSSYERLTGLRSYTHKPCSHSIVVAAAVAVELLSQELLRFIDSLRRRFH